MAQSTHSAPYTNIDDDVRDSLRVIQHQRKTRLIVAIVAMVAALVVVSLSLYYAYSSEPGAGAIPALNR